MALLMVLVSAAVAATAVASAEHYTNQFAVRVAAADGADRGRTADRVARKHGFVNRGKVSVSASGRPNRFIKKLKY